MVGGGLEGWLERRSIIESRVRVRIPKEMRAWRVTSCCRVDSSGSRDGR